ncbi:4633_t:CDS:2 [Rhizophagus irregularis]|nr:4633_t:CDS:2 [Rhizophagus irregularis]
MSDKNKKRKYSNNISLTQQSKKINNGSAGSNNNQEEPQEPQWVDLGPNKKSWVWKHFGIKTDGRAYCRYKVLRGGIEEECNYSCMYNTQTSTQQQHLNSVHKEFEKEKNQQLKINDPKLKKIIPHNKSKQQELRNAVADWLVTDSQPFNSVNGKGFLRMINKFDPAFQPPCYVTIKKDIGCGYQAVFQAIKEMIIQTCETAAITTDLWTSHAKSGYIGITCHWLSDKMELYDILLCVEPIEYPHSGDNIRQTIIKKLQLLGLESKVKVAVTDNSSNMIKTIREWDGIDRVPCSANTLQLCVMRGLEKVKIYTQQFKKLVQFFNFPKQNQRLEEAQNELASGNNAEITNNSSSPLQQSSLKILRTINDVKTRWGSSLTSWKRLQKLKDPIKRVILNLCLENDNESQKDYKQLKKLYLSDYEWKLLDELIKIFEPIEEATEWLGGQKYCTLSLIYPSIYTLNYDYIPEDDEENIENVENVENIESGESDESDYDNVTIIEGSEDECESEKKEADKHNSYSTLPKIDTIINSIKKSIYDALFYYFDSPPKFALLASLLDSRFKKMRGWPEEVREAAISLLKEEYQLLKNQAAATPQKTNMKHNYQIGGFKSRLFGLDEDEGEVCYYRRSILRKQNFSKKTLHPACRCTREQ